MGCWGYGWFAAAYCRDCLRPAFPWRARAATRFMPARLRSADETLSALRKPKDGYFRFSVMQYLTIRCPWKNELARVSGSKSRRRYRAYVDVAYPGVIARFARRCACRRRRTINRCAVRRCSGSSCHRSGAPRRSRRASRRWSLSAHSYLPWL